MNILIAFLVMLAIALIAGILILLFSHFFSVKENPLKKELRECLPGANCGACGYKGCDDYAEALAQGGVKANLCIPGSQAVADKIGTVLGIEVGAAQSSVAFVGCNGKCDVTFKTSEYDGLKTCAAVSLLYGGDNSCKYGCLGFGDCAKVCTENAICLKDGIARIDAKRCLGCGMCKDVCPKHIISIIPKKAKTVVMCSNKQKGADARKACKNACIGCKKCENTCPNGAITVKNNLAVIDYEKCVDCGECVKQCPTGCLKSV